jgi:hypothetical protein
LDDPPPVGYSWFADFPKAPLVFRDLLAKAAPIVWTVPDLGEGKLGLEHRQIIAVTGSAVLGAVGVGQAGEPFAEKGLDLGVAKSVIDVLSGWEISASEQAVVHGLEGNAALRQLALQILMAVEAELGRVRKTGAELEEEGAKVLVAAVEVIATACCGRNKSWDRCKTNW